MSRWRNVKHVGIFEFRRFFKWKQEIFSLILMAALIGITSGWGALKSVFAEEHVIAVVSEQPIPEQPNVIWQPITEAEVPEATDQLGETYDGIVVVRSGYRAELIAANTADWQSTLQTSLTNWLQQQKLADLQLSEAEIELLNQPIEIDVRVLSDGDDEDSSKRRGLVPMLILVSLMVGVFGGFGLMMTAITQEKQQRVTEQLLTLVTPSEWMDGKIAGVTLHCLKSMLTVVIIILLVATATSVMRGGAAIFPDISLIALLNTLLFVLAGLVMINSLMAGFSATIDDPNHSSRTVMLMLPALLVGAGFGVMGSPHSMFAQILSIFPLTSFAVMPIRVAEGGVPFWQWLTSLVLLLATVWLIRSAAVRLFTMGITMYGKEPTWGSIGRALTNRNPS